MDGPPGVWSVLQTPLIKQWVKNTQTESRKRTDISQNFSISVPVVPKSLCFRGFRHYLPHSKMATNNRGGVIISMEITLQHHAKRMWEEVGSAQLVSSSKV